VDHGDIGRGCSGMTDVSGMVMARKDITYLGILEGEGERVR